MHERNEDYLENIRKATHVQTKDEYEKSHKYKTKGTPKSSPRSFTFENPTALGSQENRDKLGSLPIFSPRAQDQITQNAPLSRRVSMVSYKYNHDSSYFTRDSSTTSINIVEKGEERERETSGSQSPDRTHSSEKTKKPIEGK